MKIKIMIFGHGKAIQRIRDIADLEGLVQKVTFAIRKIRICEVKNV